MNSSRRPLRLGLALLAVLLPALLGSVTPLGAEDDEPLVVGTKVTPPFVMKDAEGNWEGISVELWNGIAADLGLAFTWRETDLEGLLEGMADGTLDAAVAALTVTAEREEKMDFTHAFHTSGLGIAVPAQTEAGWRTVLGRVFSSGFLKAVLALVAILALAAVLLWIFERRRNAKQFGGSTVKGLGSAFWWSAVTMTTVGYGDKAPVTWPGRLVALIWMFASIILIAGFTGSIASQLTVTRLEGSIHGPEDLPGLRVGAVRDSTSEAFLQRRRIARGTYATVAEALEALARGDVDAVVHDRPLLTWLVANDATLAERLTVLPRTFERQDYAFALPSGSPIREAVNRALLQRINDAAWPATLERFLGP